MAGATSIETGGEPKVIQQTKVATSISSTIASIENLLLVQGEPSACMCKVSCLEGRKEDLLIPGSQQG